MGEDKYTFEVQETNANSKIHYFVFHSEINNFENVRTENFAALDTQQKS